MRSVCGQRALDIQRVFQARQQVIRTVTNHLHFRGQTFAADRAHVGHAALGDFRDQALDRRKRMLRDPTDTPRDSWKHRK